MRRAGCTLLVAVASCVLAGFWGSALARSPGLDAADQPISFTHWIVQATGGGPSTSQRVAPGGTFRICSSSRLTELQAHYRASLSSGTNVHTVWKVTGQSATSEPGKVFPKGYFYVASGHGLPDGTWDLKVVRKGKTLGSSSVTISREHC